jgi:membrane carboxypeptidase/penicillin-binding protein
MKRAMAGQPIVDFVPPSGITLVPIDPQTGFRATTQCPVVIEEAFYEGEEPNQPCPRHATDIRPVEAVPDRRDSVNGQNEEMGSRPQPSLPRQTEHPPEERKPWWRVF